ncbi:hypothetical protein LTR91_006588 [Friedmanniomyces endolithicus]|uniref:Uncharacterized protein n=1 Tax=Friedmanniomyces endolithicus TaxID=329885 RepID=A0A4U0UME7_9PEZI|nr:hypothetical protein LTS09_003749 [Friedmanniomyces endolithicus]KAK0320660.1 hypothetical protein LTR82_008373 [Friedmanniomyces endolithicus]KAK0928064.1 hypothetical protein LTR57_002798 [Friedmanniomyces endolithicus]KAK0997621.1 hypothetical protein LTR91_006588 [Friedmanniomyces endolithicus]KAK1003117.1 hypothetical protein LTS01_003988 [Friedmanniomyces endolithicus]
MYPFLPLSTLLVATTLAPTDFPFAPFNSMTDLQRRNTCYQQNPTCVSCFGAGSIECVDASSCYNPTQGETCCSNSGPYLTSRPRSSTDTAETDNRRAGEIGYCQAGYYCVDNGCCPNGSSLADCGASATVATVAPPASTSSAVSSSSITSTIMSTTSTSTPAPTTPIYVPSTSEYSPSPSSSSTTSTLTTPATSTSPTPSAATATVIPVVIPTPATASSSSSSSLVVPAQQTANAGNTLRGGVGLVFGGLGVVLFAC